MIHRFSSRRQELARSFFVDTGGDAAKTRLIRLHQFLASGKLQVKVLPDEYFGLVPGKAGGITLADGTKTAFMGSVNESVSAGKLNYELLCVR